MFECIILGDSGSGTDDQYKVSLSMAKLIKKNAKISSVIIVGDNIYPDGCKNVDDSQFEEKFREPYKNIDLPFYLCLGNHDYHLNPQSQIDYTYSHHNSDKKWNMPKKWYTQSFPHCDMFFIDTNFKYLSETDSKNQLNDTIQSIQKSSKRWKLLCGHHTWRSVGGHGNAEPKHESFMNDLLKKVKIDLYICGHDHCKSLIHVGKIPTGKYNIPTLVIGTGGKSYDESLLFLDNMNMDNSILEYFSPNLGVCHMKCSDKILTLTCYNDKLEKEYQYKIN